MENAMPLPFKPLMELAKSEEAVVMIKEIQKYLEEYDDDTCEAEDFVEAIRELLREE